MDRTQEYIDIASLIARKISDTATKDELLKIKKWIESSEGNQQIYDELVKNFDIEKKRIEFQSIPSEKAWNRLKQQLPLQPKSKRIRLNPVWRVAASLIFIALVGGTVFYLDQRHYQNTRLAEYIAPGTDKAYLITPEGKTIDLEKNTDTLVVAEDGTSFANQGKKLVQQQASAQQDKQNLLAEQFKIVVPKGGIYQLELLDGTKVWLNSDSELSFSDTRIGKIRSVQLKGEAYFEVAKDKERPFIVETNSVTVKVLGTQFNVRSYTEDNRQSITLVEGKVQASLTDNDEETAVILKPNQQFNHIGNNISGTVEEVKALSYCGWKDGIFQFNNEDMVSLLNKLSRWYDVDMVMDNTSLKDIHYTGEVRRFDQLGTILKLLELGTDIEFEIKDRQVYVKTK